MLRSHEELFKGIQSAAENLQGRANVTPIMTSRTLNRMTGAEVFLKCENFQRVGAFKFRGAYHMMSRLDEVQRRRGVVTHSSGNHAQAVALVGSLLGIQTTVVMPNNAPQIKRAAAEAYGAAVIDYNPSESSREGIVADLVAEYGYKLIPPFDHYDIVCGQGTSALEMFTQIGALDMLLVPCGGGGLLSGCAIACKSVAPDCRVIGIEPALADDAARSFHSKTLQKVFNPDTIADGTRTPSLGDITFPLLLNYVDDMRTVSETAITRAVAFLFYRMKLVVEPSGALGVAALLSRTVSARGRVGVLISGGNIDAATVTTILKG